MKRMGKHIKYNIIGITKEMKGNDKFDAQYGMFWFQNQKYHKGMEKANRILAANFWNDQTDIEEIDKTHLKDYPNIPHEYTHILTEEEYNTMRINFYEDLIIGLKKDMTEMYKTKKEWQGEQEDFDWLMAEYRWQQNEFKKEKKRIIEEQKHLREGLNPPYCYPNYKRDIDIEDPR